jgi:RNA polymerase sigma factor (TIGR02999 family)
MADGESGEVTRLLQAVNANEEKANDRFTEFIYQELHRMAHAQMASEPARWGLQTTVLVNETYIRLFGGGGEATFQKRRHFFSAAAEAMRRIRVDDARTRRRLKRGGDCARMPLLEDPAAENQDDPLALLALDEALEKLKKAAPRQAEVVQLRYFAGLSVPETAAVMGLAPRTVDADWRIARGWLHRELGE